MATKATRWVLVATAIVVPALLACGYLAVAWAANDRLPLNATVDGARVGGLSRADALQAVQETAAERLSSPVTLQGPGSWSAALTPADAGFTTDTRTVLESIPRPGWSPAALWAWAAHRVSRNTSITVDAERVSSVVGSLTAQLSRSPVEPVIRSTGGEFTFGPGTPGSVVDLDATVQEAIAAVNDGASRVPVRLRVVPPTVSEAAAASAFTRAREMITRGLSLRRDDVTVVIPGRLLTRAVSFVQVGGSLQPSVDGHVLTKRLIKRYPGLQEPPRDAEFRIKSGRPTVLPAGDGKTVDPGDVANAVRTAAASYPTAGVVAVPSVPLAPTLSEASASALGIQERLSSFTQRFPYAPYRVQNIGQAARYLDGTLLLPGEVFSMNDTIKERTPENGYTEGFIIGPGGVFQEALGGGVSTATTAVWTAAFFAGMEPVQVRAHSIYIPRYAPGLEATVAWGVFDMTFRNTSPNAVLITAKTTDSSITVQFWGTRQFDKIKAVFGPKRDVVPYSTVTDSSANCLGQDGSSGFSIDVERRFIQGGDIQRSETFTTTYRPSPRVVCS